MNKEVKAMDDGGRLPMRPLTPRARRAAASGASMLALALALSVAAPAMADDLNAALAQTYLGNPTLDAARAQLRATDEGVPQALSGWRPTVTGQVTAGPEWFHNGNKLTAAEAAVTDRNTQFYPRT